MKKKVVSIFLTIVMLVCSTIVDGKMFELFQIEASANSETSFSSMKERAETIVNYEWVPSQDINTWNNNLYKGSTIFKKGETVTGVPYTLFSWELGFDSLLSLEQYKSKSDINYSTSKYCSSVSDNRVGPAYGNCCATFVSEVFSGNFMNGSNPRYDGVGTIQNSSYSTTYTKVKIDAIQPGDALSCVSGAHIVWVGEVTDTAITIYESTPPVCQKVVLNKDTHTDSNGYLVYDDNIYNIVSKSNEIVRDDLVTFTEKLEDVPMPIKAYTRTTEKTIVYDSINGAEKKNKIYGTDICFIDAIFKNGWCHVIFPLDSGGIDYGYVKTNVFFEFDEISVSSAKASLSVYAREDFSISFGRTASGYNLYYTDETENAFQVIYPIASGGYKLGWISKSELENPQKESFFAQFCPIKGYPCVTENFEVKKNDYTTRGGEIYTTDYCTINEVYSDGWCQVTFPLDSGGELTGYTDIGKFVYDPGFEVYSYLTKEQINVYPKKELELYQNWWTGIGDTIYILGEYNNALQICYPIDAVYGGGFKLGWISRDSIAIEEPEKTVVNISIKSMPSKTEYFINETLDLTGLELTVIYSDNTTDVITTGFTISGYNSESAGIKTITVTFNDKTATFEVTVKEKEVTDILVGDVNGDGAVNSLDRVVLTRYLAEWTDYSEDNVSLEAADVNADGMVNTLDRVILTRYIAEWNGYEELPYKK